MKPSRMRVSRFTNFVGLILPFVLVRGTTICRTVLSKEEADGA